MLVVLHGSVLRKLYVYWCWISTMTEKVVGTEFRKTCSFLQTYTVTFFCTVLLSLYMHCQVLL